MTRFLRLSVFVFLALTGLLSAQNVQLVLKITPGADANNVLVVTPGKTVQFKVHAYEVSAAGTMREVPIDHLLWTLEPPTLGTITPDGLFTPAAPSDPTATPRGLVRATATAGQATATAAVPVMVGHGNSGGDATFLGMVTDDQNRPIKGALVSVMSAGMLPFMIDGKTDEKGVFSITAPQGTYVVRAEAAGYLAEFFDDAADMQTAKRIVTDPAQPLYDHIDFVLAGAQQHHDYAFEGTVTDVTGAPVSGARVTAVGTGGPNTPRIAVSAPTSKSGTYHLEVPAGTYTVFAEAMGFMSEWYDNQRDATLATQLSTDPNAKLRTGIDFSLSQGGVISGTVTEVTSQKPLSGVVLRAIPTTGPTKPPIPAGNWSAVSDDHGRYTLSGLPTFKFIVVAEAKGFRTQYYDHTEDQGAATAVQATEGSTVTDIDFALAKGDVRPDHFRISGTVRDAAGSGIGGALVTADFISPSGEVKMFTAVAGPDGAYVLGVPAGSYTVYADAPGLAREFFDNVDARAQATPVTVDANIPERTGVDFSLGAGGSISGVVLRASDGAPIAKAAVGIVGIGVGDPANSRGTVYTDADGRYLISGLSSGKVRVYAFAEGCALQYYDHVADATQASDVVVTAGQTTTGIDFSLQTVPVVTGVVLDAATGAGIAGATVQVMNVNTILAAHTEKDGTWRLALQPGSYILRATAHGYAEEWYDGKTDATTADPVVVPSSGTLNGIDFHLDRFGASIAGTVRDGAGAPIAKARVMVWSTLPPTPDGKRSFFAKGVTKDDGTYDIPGLPAGDYVVSASAPHFLSEYYDNRPDLASADPVTVGKDQAVTGVDFVLAPGASIIGVVTSSVDGSPIADAVVQVNVRANSAGFGVRTDKNGAYRIDGLPTGSYTVFAAAPRFRAEFYDDVTDPAAATPVSVTAPGTTAGVDFALDPAPKKVRRFTGSVTASDTRLAPACPIVEAVDPVTGEVLATTTDTDGSFQLDAGDNAVLRARAPGYSGTYAGNVRNWKYSSTNGFSDGLSFILEPLNESGLGTLNGVVFDMTRGRGVANAWVFGDDEEGGSFFAVTDASGMFSLPCVSTSTVNLLLSSVTFEPVESGRAIEGGSGSIQLSAWPSAVLGVGQPAAPSRLALAQNHPNPFNPATTIRFALPSAARARLTVHDLLGRTVAVLADGTVAAGEHTVTWNAAGQPSGIYLCRLEAAGTVVTRRMTLTK